MIAQGFHQSQPDHSPFVKGSFSGSSIALVVYVDNILIASNNTYAVATLKQELSQHFKMRDLGAPKYFLGLEIARSRTGISLC